MEVNKEIVTSLPRQRETRLICRLNNRVEVRCGLNHLGDGNFFIIIATRYVNQLKVREGEMLDFELWEDPNPLGVEIPEVLAALLEQEEPLRQTFERLTDGRKRTLIYAIQRTGSIDKKVQACVEFLETEEVKQRRANNKKGRTSALPS